MTTAGEIITAAAKKVSVNTITTAQTASALISLNNMLGSLGIEFLQPAVARESATLIVGTSEYTIGPAGNFVTVRPIRIEDTAYLRDSDSYDNRCRLLSSRGLGDVINKATSGQPTGFYFIPEKTNARIIFNRSPDYAYTFYFESWKPITVFAATSTTVTLPPEDNDLLVYNLAIALGEDWDRTVRPSVIMRAQELKEEIGHSNAATRLPKPIETDVPMVGKSRLQPANTSSSELDQYSVLG